MRGLFFTIGLAWCIIANTGVMGAHAATISVAADTTPRIPVESAAARDVTFTYQDANYEQVALAGSFTDWVRIPLVKTGSLWSLELSVPPGEQYYRFVVTDRGETWDAIDPDNSTALNHPEHGWVAVVDFERKAEPDRRSSEERREKRRQRSQYRNEIKQELKFGSPDHLSGSYQRVDGLTLGFALNHIGQKGSLDPSVRSQFGYGFSSGRASVGLTILQPLTSNRVLSLKASLYDWTDYSDQTGIGSTENSLAALFLHEDYRDYYRNKGIRGSVVLEPANWLRLEAGVLAEEHDSLWAPSVWSIKKGDLTANPAIDEGSLRSALARVHIGGRFNHLRVVYEHSSPDLMGGSYDFRQITATARGQLELGDRAGFDVRLKSGTNLHGRLPAQRRYVLGGLGTVRGYAYQSLLATDPDEALVPGDREPYGGEHMLLGNFEYSFQLSGWMGMALFYDAGMAWQDRDADVSLNQLKTSTGLSFMPCGSDLRFNLIQRLDDRSSDPVFQLRLQRMF